jgi:hypothetical protein
VGLAVLIKRRETWPVGLAVMSADQEERNVASKTSLLQIGSFSQHGLTCELYPVPFPDMVACGGDCGGVVTGRLQM